MRVRALFLFGNYLRYVAAPGDILMIDEPELNLHPEKQRQIARLANAGIKVSLTTHSDFSL
ncbi:MAG: ATP-binding protein [Planctomycetaceae bacterium]|nr:ATP-binding protein [Planctomycetaceae bacterium]